MLRIYQYFLFRIHHFYVNVFKERDLPTFYTGAISSLFVGLSLALVYQFFEMFGYFPKIDSSYFIVYIIFSVWILNYFLIVRKEEFLKQNFRRGVLGGVLVILYMLSIIALLIIQAKINRGEL